MGKVTKVGSSPLIYYHAIATLKATLTENTEAKRRLETVPYVLPDTEFSSFDGVSRQVILIR